MKGPLVVVGDALLDRDIDGTADRLVPDAPVPVVDESGQVVRPGGAALAAAMAAADGEEVILVTALAHDAAGRELTGLLERAGVEVVGATLEGGTPEKVRLRSQRQTLLRLDRNAATAPIGSFDTRSPGIIRSAGVVLVSDYGRGVAAHPALRAALARRPGPAVWDPHPRGAAPVPGTTLVTPNRVELHRLFPGHGGNDLPAVAARARRAREQWRAQAVVVTLGADGALLVTDDGPPLAIPAAVVPGGDTCGAGDRFAVTAARRLGAGTLISEAIPDAVASASSLVRHGIRWQAPGSQDVTVAPPPIESPATDLARRIHAEGGTLVVAGGCFDLLHAGHVALLEAARRLGDGLVVAVNSDTSVTALKGPGRPVVSEADRVAVLAALRCVDAVMLFDEASPVAVLEALRPQVFVKGGDYSGRELPEATTLTRWGGQTVVVPYLGGRSTSGLLRQVSGLAP